MAFVKLDCQILDSTLWIDREARELFLTALLMAKPHQLKEETEAVQVRSNDASGFIIPPGWYGFISAAGPGIVRRSGMDMETGLLALERLCETDPESRTPDFDGRRMARVSGGYVVLNYDKYREKDHTAAKRMKDYRDRKKESYVTRNVTSQGRHVTQAEAEAEAEFLIEPQKLEEPACLDSYVSPSEGGRAGQPDFSQKVEEVKTRAPMAEPAWMNLARKLKVDEAFATVLFAEMEVKGWIAGDGAKVAEPGKFLLAAWNRERARREAGRDTSGATGQREPWMVDRDLKRVRDEIRRISDDPASKNAAKGATLSKEEHEERYRPEWLAVVKACHDEAKVKLPDEFAAFEVSLEVAREEMRKGAAMLGVPASHADTEDVRLEHFVTCFPEDCPNFARWDREWNRGKTWKDPKGLTEEAKAEIGLLKGQVSALENERRALLSKV